MGQWKVIDLDTLEIAAEGFDTFEDADEWGEKNIGYGTAYGYYDYDSDEWVKGKVEEQRWEVTKKFVKTIIGRMNGASVIGTETAIKAMPLHVTPLPVKQNLLPAAK